MLALFFVATTFAIGSIVVLALLIAAFALKLTVKLFLLPFKLLLAFAAIPLAIVSVIASLAILPLMLVGFVLALPVLALSLFT